MNNNDDELKKVLNELVENETIEKDFSDDKTTKKKHLSFLEIILLAISFAFFIFLAYIIINFIIICNSLQNCPG